MAFGVGASFIIIGIGCVVYGRKIELIAIIEQKNAETAEKDAKIAEMTDIIEQRNAELTEKDEK
ncbi:MAG TPA: hypothetical protein VKK79_21045 [Candidatus Lokiarchaeia archaeon]|nr:hypothetical protein [Candidatus Lokiarchaeia archaeon]